MNPNIIAIDGPAGSGKSSVAREVGQKIGYNYLDTGAYYRACTLFFYREYKKNRIQKSFSEWVEAEILSEKLNKIKIESRFLPGEENKTFLNGEDVSSEIRLPEITDEIKHLAVQPKIREFVNFFLKKLSESYKLVMDGRDIGTEVFPDARYKFFLTASVQERAKRRLSELQEKGIEVDLQKLESDIQKRDDSDRNRKIAPLKQASDAIVIDTTSLTKKDVINAILSRINEA